MLFQQTGSARGIMESHMRYCTAMLLACLAAARLGAQEISPPSRPALDSGTVVRLHWKDGTEKARLLSPLGPDSSLLRYCRYPSPVCGTSNLNPSQARSVRDWEAVPQ
jgi:hypothetical protein